MQEELEQVRKDIVDLQHRLSILYDREKRIKHKTPPNLVGKYIYQEDNILEMYMRVDSIEWDYSWESYVAIGPSIDVSNRLIDIDYSLNSNNIFNLSEKYKISSKEEYDKILSEALKSF